MWACASELCDCTYSTKGNLEKHYKTYPTHQNLMIESVCNPLFRSVDLLKYGTIQTKMGNLLHRMFTVNMHNITGCPYWSACDDDPAMFPAKRAILQFIGLPKQSQLFNKNSLARQYLDSVFSTTSERTLYTSIPKGSRNQAVKSLKVRTCTFGDVIYHGIVIKAVFFKQKDIVLLRQITDVSLHAIAGDPELAMAIMQRHQMLKGTGVPEILIGSKNSAPTIEDGVLTDEDEVTFCVLLIILIYVFVFVQVLSDGGSDQYDGFADTDAIPEIIPDVKADDEDPLEINDNVRMMVPRNFRELPRCYQSSLVDRMDAVFRDVSEAQKKCASEVAEAKKKNDAEVAEAEKQQAAAVGIARVVEIKRLAAVEHGIKIAHAEAEKQHAAEVAEAEKQHVASVGVARLAEIKRLGDVAHNIKIAAASQAAAHADVVAKQVFMFTQKQHEFELETSRIRLENSKRKRSRKDKQDSHKRRKGNQDTDGASASFQVDQKKQAEITRQELSRQQKAIKDAEMAAREKEVLEEQARKEELAKKQRARKVAENEARVEQERQKNEVERKQQERIVEMEDDHQRAGADEQVEEKAPIGGERQVESWKERMYCAVQDCDSPISFTHDHAIFIECQRAEFISPENKIAMIRFKRLLQIIRAHQVRAPNPANTQSARLDAVVDAVDDVVDDAVDDLAEYVEQIGDFVNRWNTKQVSRKTNIPSHFSIWHHVAFTGIVAPSQQNKDDLRARVVAKSGSMLNSVELGEFFSIRKLSKTDVVPLTDAKLCITWNLATKATKSGVEVGYNIRMRLR
jgi:hypothetical protein